MEIVFAHFMFGIFTIVTLAAFVAVVVRWERRTREDSIQRGLRPQLVSCESAKRVVLYHLYGLAFASLAACRGETPVARQPRPNMSVRRSANGLYIEMNLAPLGRCDAPPELGPDGRYAKGWVIMVQFIPQGYFHESQPGTGSFAESVPSSWDGNYILGARCGTLVVHLPSGT